MEVNYKVYDDIYYQLEFDIWDTDLLDWLPFVTDDIVMEFKMLDPYYRVTLEHKEGTSIYWTEIKVLLVSCFIDFCRLPSNTVFFNLLLITTNLDIHSWKSQQRYSPYLHFT